MVSLFKKLLACCLAGAASGIFVVFGISTAHAAGTFLTNDYLQVAPTETKAAIFHDGKRETLIVSETFSFNPLLGSNFIWLIPVPSAPEVELITSDFFAQVEKLSKADTAPDTLRTRGVSLMHSKTFAPGKGFSDMRTWVANQGYFIPKRLNPSLSEYEKNGWYLVAVLVDGIHIQRDASESLTIDTVRTFPVKISFDTEVPVNPLRLASIEPDIDAPAATLFYGVSSEKVLGVKDVEIDALLSKQSANRFPRLPLGASNIKIDIFVFAKSAASAEGLSAASEMRIDGRKFGKGTWNAFYLDLPPEDLILTHLEGFRHVEDLDDISVITANAGIGAERSFAAAGSLFLKKTDFITVLFIFLSFLLGTFLGRKQSRIFRACNDWKKRLPVLLESGETNKRVSFSVFTIALVIGLGLVFFDRGDGAGKKQEAQNSASPVSDMSAAAAIPDMNMNGAVNGREIAVVSDDFSFSPRNITVKSGERAVLHVNSSGLHSFTVKELGIHIQTPAGVTDVAFTPVKKGIFDIYCDMPGHQEAGHAGTLTVE